MLAVILKEPLNSNSNTTSINIMKQLSLTFLFVSLVFSYSNTFGQPQKKLEISHLAGNFYVFTTYNFYKRKQVGKEWIAP